MIYPKRKHLDIITLGIMDMDISAISITTNIMVKIREKKYLSINKHNVLIWI
jgi:hypothetical protein